MRTALIVLYWVYVFWAQSVWAFSCGNGVVRVTGKVTEPLGFLKGNDMTYKYIPGAKVYIFINGGASRMVEDFHPKERQSGFKYIDYVSTNNDGSFQGNLIYNKLNEIEYFRGFGGKEGRDCSGMPILFDFFVLKKGYHPGWFKGSSDEKYRQVPYSRAIKFEGRNDMIEKYAIDNININSIRN